MRLPVFISLILLVLSNACQRENDADALFAIKEYGRWGFIDNRGKTIIPCTYAEVAPFSEGLAAVRKDSLWGFINSQNELVIPYRYIASMPSLPVFQNGICYVQEQKDSIIHKFFIRKNGTIAFATDYDTWEIGKFNSGLARIEVNEEVCFIDTTGKVIIKTGFPYGWQFSEDIGHVWTGDSTHYIDKSGKIILKLSGMGHEDFSEGLALISNDGGYYIDRNGNRIINQQAGDLMYHSFSDSMAQVYDRDKNLYGFVNRKGEFVIKPRFDQACDFKQGLAAVVDSSGKWGFIDKKGVMVIAPQFNQIEWNDGFKNDLCRVEDEKRFGYINLEGKYVWREQPLVLYEKLNLENWGADTLLTKVPIEIQCNAQENNFIHQGDFEKSSDLKFMVDTTQLTIFQDKYIAYKLWLINSTKDSIELDVEDGRLKIIPQAVNRNGEWQDIGYFYNSWCGNSYYTLPFASNNYLVFAAPVYKGEIKTRLRFRLELGEKTIYSNAYTGTITSGQLQGKPHRQFSGAFVCTLKGCKHT